MKLLVRNRFYRLLTLSDFFNGFGASIYNLVFIVFASSMDHRKLAIGIAAMITFVPTIFNVLISMYADRTKDKGRIYLALGYVQAILFILIAFLTQSVSWLAFSTVCLINILSDMLSTYRSGLKLPMIQTHVAEEDLMEAFSFRQVVSVVSLLGGQALGVWLLSISHNHFFLVSLVNAATFLTSTLILLGMRQELTYQVRGEELRQPFFRQFKELYTNLRKVFQGLKTGNFELFLLAVLLINALGGSITPIYQLSFTDAPLFGLSFSQSLFLLQVISITGTILGGLTPNDYFSKQSFNTILKIVAGLLVLIATSNALAFSPVISLLLLIFLSYLAGKINPKLQAMLMKEIPSNVLAQTGSFLELLFTLSMPLGTALFTSLALASIWLSWVIFAGLALLTLGISLCLSARG
ncbi:MFS transporter [Streptococcus pneumoniae]